MIKQNALNLGGIGLVLFSLFFFISFSSATTIGNNNISGVVIQYPSSSGTPFNNNTYGANITEVDPIYTSEKASYLPFWINWTLISNNLFAPINSGWLAENNTENRDYLTTGNLTINNITVRGVATLLGGVYAGNGLDEKQPILIIYNNVTPKPYLEYDNNFMNSGVAGASWVSAYGPAGFSSRSDVDVSIITSWSKNLSAETSFLLMNTNDLTNGSGWLMTKRADQDDRFVLEYDNYSGSTSLEALQLSTSGNMDLAGNITAHNLCYANGTGCPASSGISITNNLTLANPNGYNATLIKNDTGFYLYHQTTQQGAYGKGIDSVMQTSGGGVNTTANVWNMTEGTLKIWAYTRNLGPGCQASTCTLLNTETSGGDGSFMIRYTNGNVQFYYSSGQSSSISSANDLNTWVQYIVTWNTTAPFNNTRTGKYLAYRNGVLVINFTTNNSYSTSNKLSIGGNGVGSRTFNGTIDEVAIYKNKVFTQAEITADYNGGIGTRTSETDAGLSALYHFDETSTTIGSDWSGNGNNLTLGTSTTRQTGIIRLSTIAGAFANLISSVNGVQANEKAVTVIGDSNMETEIRGSRVYFGNGSMRFGDISVNDLNATSIRGNGENISGMGGNKNAILYQDGTGAIKGNNRTGLFYDALNSLIYFNGWITTFRVTDYSNNSFFQIRKEWYKNKMTMSTEVENMSSGTTNGMKLVSSTGNAVSGSFNGFNTTVGGIGFWINLSSTDCADASNTCDIFTSNVGGGDGNIYARYTDGGSTTLYLAGQSMSTSLQANNLTFIVMTWDSSANQFKGYKNGVLISTGTFAGTTASTGLTVGGLGSNQRVMGGTLDEMFTIKGRVISQEEITNLYNSGIGMRIPNNFNGLGTLWHFEADGTDSSGNGNTLTITTHTFTQTAIPKEGAKNNLTIIQCENGQVAGENGICTYGDNMTRMVLRGSNITIGNGITAQYNCTSYPNVTISGGIITAWNC